MRRCHDHPSPGSPGPQRIAAGRVRPGTGRRRAGRAGVGGAVPGGNSGRRACLVRFHSLQPLLLRAAHRGLAGMGPPGGSARPAAGAHRVARAGGAALRAGLVRRRADRHHGGPAAGRRGDADRAGGLAAGLAAGVGVFLLTRLSAVSGAVRVVPDARSAGHHRMVRGNRADAAGHSACGGRVHHRGAGRDVLRRRGLCRPALPDRGDRVRRAVCLPDLSQPVAAAGVHSGVLHGADSGQRHPRAGHRGRGLPDRQRRGGGGGPHHLRLGLLLGGDCADDTGRAAVPAGSDGAAPRRAHAGPPAGAGPRAGRRPAGAAAGRHRPAGRSHAEQRRDAAVRRPARLRGDGRVQGHG